MHDSEAGSEAPTAGSAADESRDGRLIARATTKPNYALAYSDFTKRSATGA
ncbi:MAG: hypothetical protein KJ057_13830 [Phycisphaerae bacterium]|nr:hypothetical protein [Planctomycetia bacterium]MCL4719545.1 hypothetical protein [Phycisphaerae bacterium]